MRERVLRYCLAPGLLRAVRGATANVERHVAELNALNVYPVPDGDTGINMMATMRAALAEAETLPAERATLADVAAAASFGALMGARGNSGVILSQVLRGMAESAAGHRRADARLFAEALEAGTRTAYAAVARPVEGTILTVVRQAARAATEAAERGEPLGAVLAIAAEAANEAVARTPEQLDVLRHAGVVDAGGQGLFRALEGAVDAMVEEPVRARVLAERGAGAEALPVRSATGLVPHAQAPATLPVAGHGGWGYETMFVLKGRDRLDVAAMRRHLEKVGESVLVAGDEQAVKVHVHNDRPDEIIAYGLSLGTLGNVVVENLDDQTERMRSAHTPAAEAPKGERTPANRASARVTATRLVGVVAVASGDGTADIFRSFGVEGIVPAPWEGNPSTGQILAVIDTLEAETVVVLPNDPNVVLAAEQAARSADGRQVAVVPTRSAPEGFAALLVLDQSAGAEANVAPMLAAAREVQTLLVWRADRAARYGQRRIDAGQVAVARTDRSLVAVGRDAAEAIAEAVDGIDPGFELLTLYLGEGAGEAEAEEIARVVGERRPGTEVEIVAGGQPHYRYIVSAE